MRDFSARYEMRLVTVRRMLRRLFHLFEPDMLNRRLMRLRTSPLLLLTYNRKSMLFLSPGMVSKLVMIHGVTLPMLKPRCPCGCVLYHLTILWFLPF